MKVKASSIGRVLADLDMILDDVVEVTIMPGKVRVIVTEDGYQLVREYGVDQHA
jgi:hypothetical protein